MESADYVIVGAGSAGCVLASRLSEDAASEIALLEAGGEDDSPTITQPSEWPLLWDSADAWGYATTRQSGYNDRTIACPRGKVLGGTSSLNAMIYVRGDPHDFDHWRDLGNDGWGWADVLPYFIKSEDQSRGASPLHGRGGPLTVSDPESPHPRSLAFVEAAVACGHRRNPDFNGTYLDGAGLYQRTVRNGKRCSTAVAFLRPASRRGNLKILSKARALRVLLEGDRAVGVEYWRDGAIHQLLARREVIVSAGAIDSPKLLMLSGIGDATQLQAPAAQRGSDPYLDLERHCVIGGSALDAVVLEQQVAICATAGSRSSRILARCASTLPSATTRSKMASSVRRRSPSTPP
jgi:choline dehydrogenase